MKVLKHRSQLSNGSIPSYRYFPSHHSESLHTDLWCKDPLVLLSRGDHTSNSTFRVVHVTFITWDYVNVDVWDCLSTDLTIINTNIVSIWLVLLIQIFFLSQLRVFAVRLFHPQLSQSSLSTLDGELLNNDLWILETHHKQQIQIRFLKVLFFLKMDYPKCCIHPNLERYSIIIILVKVY